MKDIRAVRGKFYLRRLIDQGEHEHQDFKFAISDAFKIARSVSAFANNDGGRLLIGVKDNGVIAGVRNEEDIYVVEQAASMYCRPEVPLDVRAFRDADGAVVLVVEIARAATRPVMARDADGTWRAYYRVADENIVAHPLMIGAWRRRNDTQAPPLVLDAASRTLLDIINAAQAIDVDTLARKAHLSRPLTDSTVIALAAMDLVGFSYTAGAFRIVPLDPTL